MWLLDGVFPKMLDSVEPFMFALVMEFSVMPCDSYEIQEI